MKLLYIDPLPLPLKNANFGKKPDLNRHLDRIVKPDLKFTNRR